MADERANGLRVRFVRGLDRPCRATADCTTLSSSLSSGPHLSVSSINHHLLLLLKSHGRCGDILTHRIRQKAAYLAWGVRN
jgi:hypothetical protein